MRNALRSFTLTVAAASMVAAVSQTASADAPAAAPTAGPPVCGTYVPPKPYPDKDYITGSPLAAQYKNLQDLVASTASYSMTIIAHEVKGSDTQDRTYHFTYLCPSMDGTASGHPEEARISIIAGSGKLADPGAEALWHGGTKIRGHQGGAIAHLKIIAEYTDPRATSLRGRTINTSVFSDMLLSAKTQGKIVQDADQTITIKTETGTETHMTHVYEQTVDNPANDFGLTSEKIYLDATTNYLVHHEGFENGKLVETEDFSALNRNANLTPADFQ